MSYGRLTDASSNDENSALKKAVPSLLKELNQFIEVQTSIRVGGNTCNTNPNLNTLNWLFAGGSLILLGASIYLWYAEGQHAKESNEEQKPYWDLAHTICLQIEEQVKKQLPYFHNYLGKMEKCEWRPGLNHDDVAEDLFNKIKDLVSADLMKNYIDVCNKINTNEGALVVFGIMGTIFNLFSLVKSGSLAVNLRAARNEILNEPFSYLGFSSNNEEHQKIIQKFNTGVITTKDMIEKIRDFRVDRQNTPVLYRPVVMSPSHAASSTVPELVITVPEEQRLLRSSNSPRSS